MFQLDNENVKLANVNPRAEKHGEDTEMACDLKFEISTSNDVLSEFHHALKSAFYKEADQPDLIDEPGRLSQLKFPEISSIAFDRDFSGYELRIHYGLGGKSDLVMDDCKVNNFRFHMMEGGTVVMSFRVQGRPSEHVIGKYCTLIQQDVIISLTPPGETQLDIEAAEIKGTKKKNNAGSATAGMH